MEFKFKKKFGQNFIKDTNLIKAIVKDACVNEKVEVLEIGSGMGALTTSLDQVAKKVVSYEIDTELKGFLESLNLKNTSFKFGDALKLPICEIEKDFNDKYSIVANLPYYITTPLLFKFLEETDRVKSITVMVQKEVAERIVAKPKEEGYGIPSVIFAFYGSPKITRIVKRNMFYPVPNVDSAILHMEINRRQDVDNLKFSSFVRASFAMKRKTLINNLEKYTNKGKGEIEQVITNLGFNPSIRAEELSLEDFIKLYKALLTNIT